MFRGMMAGLVSATVAIAAPGWAQGSQVSSAVELARKADALKPGDWVWAPGIAPAGPVHIYVDLSRQIATIYRNGVRIGVSTISSGKAGHEDPGRGLRHSAEGRKPPFKQV